MLLLNLIDVKWKYDELVLAFPPGSLAEDGAANDKENGRSRRRFLFLDSTIPFIDKFTLETYIH
ncbi:hypothetical protein J23TS9_40870 [Paenibacillus sp. J23TS9]|nr:hypothetical protein J23TS9_40870 [Paenibacillus sp. J23TS9]